MNMSVPRVNARSSTNLNKKPITNAPPKASEYRKTKNVTFHNELSAIIILLSAIKLLLVYTYRSTDFEVHRNWLAITHNLSIDEWYVNNKSQWTLDYPPFFGWFELCLSYFGKLVDPDMLNIDNFDHASPGTVLFQRITVIISDLTLFHGVREIGSVFCATYENSMAFILLSLFNVGLLIVDHIHFQYNGFLLGILLLSIARVSESQSLNILKGAIYFAVLLNFKHIYLYVAPAFVVWLLKWYCWRNHNFFKKLIQLGIIVVTTMLISFGPFANQLPQVFSRLFPFRRGLVHAYWAANIWALYISMDKILSLIWRNFGWLSIIKTATLTGGLVQEDTLAVLPMPTPLITFVATFVSMLPITCLLATSDKHNLHRTNFVRCLVLCALSSFQFGWHVHEKAILTAIIPLSILAVINVEDARTCVILSSAGHTALLPLLFPKNLIYFKMIVVSLYTAITALCLQRLFNQPLLRFHECLYICTSPFLTLYETIIHKMIFHDNLPFLPLAITSIFCAIGVTYSWVLCFLTYFYCSIQTDVKRKILYHIKLHNL